jgi:SNF2 family DNA or RNA helicase
MLRSTIPLSILVLATLFVAPATLAQTGGRPEAGTGNPKEYLENRMAELEKLLDLSDAQAIAIQALQSEFFLKIDSVRSTGADRRAMGSALRELRDQTDREVVKLLSDDQAEKYRAFREDEMERMRNRMRQRQGPGGRPGRN